MRVSDKTIQMLRAVRTSDITDALDSMGHQDLHEVDPVIRPLFTGMRFVGRARTQLYRKSGTPLPYMEYEEWARRQYHKVDGKPTDQTLWYEPEWKTPLGKDDVLVIDAQRSKCGIIGSNNTLAMQAMGVVGFVVDGNCRDSGECIAQRTPVFSAVRALTHPMGRLVAADSDVPVTIGGAVVNPGDIIAADDDGVVVVPQEIADEVARRAHLIQRDDRPGRRRLYEKLGLELDESVEI